MGASFPPVRVHLFLPLRFDPRERSLPWAAIPCDQGEVILQERRVHLGSMDRGPITLNKIVAENLPTKKELDRLRFKGISCVNNEGIAIKGMTFSAQELLDEMGDHFGPDKEMSRWFNGGWAFFAFIPEALMKMPEHASPITFTGMSVSDAPGRKLGPWRSDPARLPAHESMRGSCCFIREDYDPQDVGRKTPCITLTDDCPLAIFVDDLPEDWSRL